MKALILLALLASPAFADSRWTDGVSEEAKAEAENLLAQGNQQFVDGRIEEALATYRRAVAAWDHPAIRFNIVRVLIRLERPVEAAANLERALAYGPEPLEEAVYREALNYQALLAKRIADVQIACAQPGAKVTLDGNAFLDCPGHRAIRVEIGHHQVVAQKRDFITRTEDFTALPGQHVDRTIALVALADAGVKTRRWTAWKPYAVLGGGVLVAGIGTLVELQARGDLDAYRAAVARECQDRPCPTLDGAITALDDSARLEHGIAVGLLVTGIAVAATGGVLAVMNREHTVYPGSHQPSVAISPVASGAVVTSAFAF